jgi:phage gp29-like protein
MGKPLPSQLKTEVVSIDSDPKFMFGSNMVLPPQDKVLVKQGRGEFLSIYRDLLRDTRVKTTLDKRITNVVRAEWIVEPGMRRGMSVTAEDRRLADMVREQLQAMGSQSELDKTASTGYAAFQTGFDAVTESLLEAILMGFKVGEMIWAQDGKTVYVDRVRLRDERRFRFDRENRLRLITSSNMWLGEETVARKYLVYTWGSQFDPYGQGLGHQLYWPVFFKRQDISYWLRFLDKFGSPTVVAKGEADQKDSLLDAAEAVQSEAAVFINQGEMLEMLEANRSALSSGGYDALVEYLDKEITTLMLGSTLSTDIGDKGSFAAAKVHADETRLRGMTDARVLNEYLTRSLSNWITYFNSDTAVAPTIKRLFPEEEDLTAVADRWSKLFAMGYVPTPEFVNEKFGKGPDEPVFLEKQAQDDQNEANPNVQGNDDPPQNDDSEEDDDA